MSQCTAHQLKRVHGRSDSLEVEGVLLVVGLKPNGPSVRVDVELPCIGFSTLEMQKMTSECPRQFSRTTREKGFTLK